MQKRENLLYVGIDLHKETHTAVMVNCWNEKLEVVVIENKLTCIIFDPMVHLCFRVKNERIFSTVGFQE